MKAGGLEAVIGGAIAAIGSGIGSAMEADASKEAAEAQRAGPRRGGMQKKMFGRVTEDIGNAITQPPRVYSTEQPIINRQMISSPMKAMSMQRPAFKPM